MDNNALSNSCVTYVGVFSARRIGDELSRKAWLKVMPRQAKGRKAEVEFGIVSYASLMCVMRQCAK